MPKPKLVPSPEALGEEFNNYKNIIKSTPTIVVDFVGGKGSRAEREKERPLTMEGFENHCYQLGWGYDLDQYFANREDRYSEYVSICRVIRRMIRQDQIEGGMTGIYNPSITQRLNGLVEKTQNENINREVPLFPDVE